MSEAKKPKSIVLNARTTQELTIDKEALARWAQDFVERGAIAHGITKHEIEKGFCRYQLNYEQLAMLSETVMQNLIDSGKIKGYGDVHITGSGKNIGLAISMDMAVPPPSMGLRVINGPDGAKPLAPLQALEQLKKAVTFDMNGLTIDSAVLAGSLQSLSNYFQEMNHEFPNQLKAMSPEDRLEVLQNLAEHMKPFLDKAGIEVGPIKGTNMQLTFRYDKLLALAEQHGAVDRGYIVKRNGDGTASMLVDYRRIVDMAVDKAQAMLAEKNPDGHSHITPIDADTFKLVLSKGSNGSGINKLLEMVAEKALALREQTHGDVRRVYGTINAPKTQDPNLPKF